MDLAKFRKDLANLTTSMQNLSVIEDKDLGENVKSELDDLVRRVRSSDVEVRLDAFRSTSKLSLTDRALFLNEIITSPIFPALVDGLKKDNDPNLQFEAALALTNIAAGDTNHTRAVVRAGAVEHFVRLLMSPQVNVREQALWALSNIIVGDAECGEYVLRQGFIDHLQTFVNPNTNLPCLRNVAWVIFNLCRNLETPLPSIELIARLTPVLFILIQHTDRDILTHSVWAVLYITERGPEYLQQIIDCGIIRYIIPMMHGQDSILVDAVIRTAVNIASGTDDQIQVIIDPVLFKPIGNLEFSLNNTDVDNGVLTYIPCLLDHRDANIIKMTTLLLSNITGGDEQQLDAVIQSNVIPRVIYLLERSELQSQREALRCLANLCIGGNQEHIRYLLHQNVTLALSNLLKCDNEVIVSICIGIIQKLLDYYTGKELRYLSLAMEKSNSLKNIYERMSHRDKQIVKTILERIDSYFRPLYRVDIY